MTAQTLLLDFALPEGFEQSKVEEIVLTMLNELIDQDLDEKMRLAGERVDTVVYSSPNDLVMMLRVDKERRLLTINIDAPHLASTGLEFKDKNLNGDPPMVGCQSAGLAKWEALLSSKLEAQRSNMIPVMVRGMEFSPYWTTTGRIYKFAMLY